MSARTFSLEPNAIIAKSAAKYPVTVNFSGTALIGLLDGDTAWVAMRPIVEGMGLAWQGQYDKIMEDEVLASVVMQKLMTGADGKRYKMVCLPEDYLQGWLFTVNPKKVKPELRAHRAIQTPVLSGAAQRFYPAQHARPFMAHRIPADLPRLARHHCRKSGHVQQRQVCAFEREQSHKRRLRFGQRPADGKPYCSWLHK